MKRLLALVVCALIPVFSSAGVKPLHVDLRDVAHWVSYKSFPEAHIIWDSIRSETDRYFPSDISLERIYGVEVSEILPPSAFEDDLEFTELKLAAFFGSEQTGFRFRRFYVKVSAPIKSVLIVRAEGEDIPLENARFTIRASLVQRKVILEDANLGIRKIYPIGVGGFDPGITEASRGKTRLVTPTFQGASLDRETAIPSRTEPSYYKGKPFLRLTRRNGDQTPYAFHITQGETEKVNGSHVERMRGFFSHGCMRMREKDLGELFKILYYGYGHIPTDVSLFLMRTEDFEHPYAPTQSQYRAVVNHCTPEAPCSGKDKDGLTHMEMLYGRPPIEKVYPFGFMSRDLIEAPNGDAMSLAEMNEFVRD